VAAAAPDRRGVPTACTRNHPGYIRLCGPASATLSGAFARKTTWRGGICKRSIVAGDPVLYVELGELASPPNATTNNGHAYFQLQINGPLAHPTGGHVISYAGGKRWAGIGESFKGNTRGGTFVVRAANGHTATGTLSCYRRPIGA
jgi:hypothetical protein